MCRLSFMEFVRVPDTAKAAVFSGTWNVMAQDAGFVKAGNGHHAVREKTMDSGQITIEEKPDFFAFLFQIIESRFSASGRSGLAHAFQPICEIRRRERGEIL